MSNKRIGIAYEYLKRCRELADKKPPEDIVSTVTVYKSPAYVKLLVYAENLKNQESYLLTRLKEADANNNLPPELFDGNAVYENLPDRNKLFIKTGYVSDVLDSAVKLIRERLAMVVVLCGMISIVSTEVYTCVGCP